MRGVNCLLRKSDGASLSRCDLRTRGYWDRRATSRLAPGRKSPPFAPKTPSADLHWLGKYSLRATTEAVQRMAASTRNPPRRPHPDRLARRIFSFENRRTERPHARGCAAASEYDGQPTDRRARHHPKSAVKRIPQLATHPTGDSDQYE